MKLCKTVLDREECLEFHRGYTEYNDERFVLRESAGLCPRLVGNHILFAYEQDRFGADTGLNAEQAKEMLRDNNILPVLISDTYGGYVSNVQGHIAEEKGLLLTFSDVMNPVSLGSLAHKIAGLFRQESMLAIYNDEVTFVYA